MDIILYNPLSRNGRNQKIVDKLTLRLEKEGHEVIVFNLLDLSIDFVDMLKEKPLDARVIIVGGDGTLHRLVNYIQDKTINQEIFLYRGGTGNDFARSLHTKEKLIPIKQYLFNLPYTNINAKKHFFLNGVGLGLDGRVVYEVNETKGKKNKRNYFRKTMKTFFLFKPFKARIKLNNEEHEFNKAWMVTVMNSKYFGGGMRIAPKASRDNDDLYVIVVSKIPKVLLLLIFPIIYLGLHVYIKPFVKVYKTKALEVEANIDTYAQLDGEHLFPVNKMKIKR